MNKTLYRNHVIYTVPVVDSDGRGIRWEESVIMDSKAPLSKRQAAHRLTYEYHRQGTVIAVESSVYA